MKVSKKILSGSRVWFPDISNKLKSKLLCIYSTAACENQALLSVSRVSSHAHASLFVRFTCGSKPDMGREEQPIACLHVLFHIVCMGGTLVFIYYFYFKCTLWSLLMCALLQYLLENILAAVHDVGGD